MNLIKSSTLALCLSVGAFATPSMAAPIRPITGTIAISASTAEVDFPAMATFGFKNAVDAALAAAPGAIFALTLSEEDGFLIWVATIVTADKKMKEVWVDAGNGKVLNVADAPPDENGSSNDADNEGGE